MVVWREIRRQPATALWAALATAAIAASAAVALRAPSGPGFQPGQPAFGPAIVVQPASPAHGSQVPVPADPSHLPPR